MKKSVVFSIVALFIVGCSTQFASNGEKLYLRNKNGPGIVVQPPLTDTNISHFYDLPTQQNKHPKVSVVPPTIEANKQESL